MGEPSSAPTTMAELELESGLTWEEAVSRLTEIESHLKSQIQSDINHIRLRMTSRKIEDVSVKAYRLREIRLQIANSKALNKEESVIMKEFEKIKETLAASRDMDEDNWSLTKNRTRLLGDKLIDVRKRQRRISGEVEDLESTISDIMSRIDFSEDDEDAPDSGVREGETLALSNYPLFNNAPYGHHLSVPSRPESALSNDSTASADYKGYFKCHDTTATDMSQSESELQQFLLPSNSKKKIKPRSRSNKSEVSDDDEDFCTMEDLYIKEKRKSAIEFKKRALAERDSILKSGRADILDDESEYWGLQEKEENEAKAHNEAISLNSEEIKSTQPEEQKGSLSNISKGLRNKERDHDAKDYGEKNDLKNKDLHSDNVKEKEDKKECSIKEETSCEYGKSTEKAIVPKELKNVDKKEERIASKKDEKNKPQKGKTSFKGKIDKNDVIPTGTDGEKEEKVLSEKEMLEDEAPKLKSEKDTIKKDNEKKNKVVKKKKPVEGKSKKEEEELRKTTVKKTNKKEEMSISKVDIEKKNVGGEMQVIEKEKIDMRKADVEQQNSVGEREANKHQENIPSKNAVKNPTVQKVKKLKEEEEVSIQKKDKINKNIAEEETTIVDVENDKDTPDVKCTNLEVKDKTASELKSNKEIPVADDQRVEEKDKTNEKEETSLGKIEKQNLTKESKPTREKKEKTNKSISKEEKVQKVKPPKTTKDESKMKDHFETNQRKETEMEAMETTASYKNLEEANLELKIGDKGQKIKGTEKNTISSKVSSKTNLDVDTDLECEKISNDVKGADDQVALKNQKDVKLKIDESKTLKGNDTERENKELKKIPRRKNESDEKKSTTELKNKKIDETKNKMSKDKSKTNTKQNTNATEDINLSGNPQTDEISSSKIDNNLISSMADISTSKEADLEESKVSIEPEEKIIKTRGIKTPLNKKSVNNDKTITQEVGEVETETNSEYLVHEHCQSSSMTAKTSVDIQPSSLKDEIKSKKIETHKKGSNDERNQVILTDKSEMNEQPAKDTETHTYQQQKDTVKDPLNELSSVTEIKIPKKPTKSRSQSREKKPLQKQNSNHSQDVEKGKNPPQPALRKSKNQVVSKNVTDTESFRQNSPEYVEIDYNEDRIVLENDKTILEPEKCDLLSQERSPPKSDEKLKEPDYAVVKKKPQSRNSSSERKSLQEPVYSQIQKKKSTKSDQEKGEPIYAKIKKSKESHPGEKEVYNDETSQDSLKISHISAEDVHEETLDTQPVPRKPKQKSASKGSVENMGKVGNNKIKINESTTNKTLKKVPSRDPSGERSSENDSMMISNNDPLSLNKKQKLNVNLSNYEDTFNQYEDEYEEFESFQLEEAKTYVEDEELMDEVKHSENTIHANYTSNSFRTPTEEQDLIQRNIPISQKAFQNNMIEEYAVDNNSYEFLEAEFDNAKMQEIVQQEKPFRKKSKKNPNVDADSLQSPSATVLKYELGDENFEEDSYDQEFTRSNYAMSEEEQELGLIKSLSDTQIRSCKPDTNDYLNETFREALSNDAQQTMANMLIDDTDYSLEECEERFLSEEPELFERNNQNLSISKRPERKKKPNRSGQKFAEERNMHNRDEEFNESNDLGFEMEDPSVAQDKRTFTNAMFDFEFDKLNKPREASLRALRESHNKDYEDNYESNSYSIEPQNDTEDIFHRKTNELGIEGVRNSKLSAESGRKSKSRTVSKERPLGRQNEALEKSLKPSNINELVPDNILHLEDVLNTDYQGKKTPSRISSRERPNELLIRGKDGLQNEGQHKLSRRKYQRSFSSCEDEEEAEDNEFIEGSGLYEAEILLDEINQKRKRMPWNNDSGFGVDHLEFQKEMMKNSSEGSLQPPPRKSRSRSNSKSPLPKDSIKKRPKLESQARFEDYEEEDGIQNQFFKAGELDALNLMSSDHDMYEYEYDEQMKKIKKVSFAKENEQFILRPDPEVRIIPGTNIFCFSPSETHEQPPEIESKQSGRGRMKTKDKIVRKEKRRSESADAVGNSKKASALEFLRSMSNFSSPLNTLNVKIANGNHISSDNCIINSSQTNDACSLTEKTYMQDISYPELNRNESFEKKSSIFGNIIQRAKSLSRSNSRQNSEERSIFKGMFNNKTSSTVANNFSPQRSVSFDGFARKISIASSYKTAESSIASTDENFRDAGSEYPESESSFMNRLKIKKISKTSSVKKTDFDELFARGLAMSAEKEKELQINITRSLNSTQPLLNSDHRPATPFEVFSKDEVFKKSQQGAGISFEEKVKYFLDDLSHQPHSPSFQDPMNHSPVAAAAAVAAMAPSRRTTTSNTIPPKGYSNPEDIKIENSSTKDPQQFLRRAEEFVKQAEVDTEYSQPVWPAIIQSPEDLPPPKRMISPQIKSKNLHYPSLANSQPATSTSVPNILKAAPLPKEVSQALAPMMAYMMQIKKSSMSPDQKRSFQISQAPEGSLKRSTSSTDPFAGGYKIDRGRAEYGTLNKREPTFALMETSNKIRSSSVSGRMTGRENSLDRIMTLRRSTSKDNDIGHRRRSGEPLYVDGRPDSRMSDYSTDLPDLQDVEISSMILKAATENQIPNSIEKVDGESYFEASAGMMKKKNKVLNEISTEKLAAKEAKTWFQAFLTIILCACVIVFIQTERRS